MNMLDLFSNVLISKINSTILISGLLIVYPTRKCFTVLSERHLACHSTQSLEEEKVFAKKVC